MKIIFGGGRISLDRRARLVKLHVEGIVLLGNGLSLLFASSRFTVFKSKPGETSHKALGLVGSTYTYNWASHRKRRLEVGGGRRES
jgi:hypothetical protein